MLLIFVLFVVLSVSQPTTLRQAAQGKHLTMGSAVNYGRLNDQTYTKVNSEQYNLVTAENGCKWGATEPNRGQFDFTQCDGVLQYAKKTGQAFRGHNLCWGESNPGWLLNGGFTPTEKKDLLANHITTVIKRYNDTPVCWDVVNEAVTDSPSGTFKSNVWYPDIPDYVDFAFQTARAANPNVKLFYNDYNIASSSGYSATKAQKVYDMVSGMKQRGIPIDGVGFQLHIGITYSSSMIDGVKQNIARFAALGLEVHFTEMDVSCGSSSCNWTPQDAQNQATIYGGLLQVCLDEPKCTNFETWGFTDKYTWLGSENHPLPFDENYNPKPAFNTLLQTLIKGSSEK